MQSCALSRLHPPASYITYRPIRTFTAQNTGFSGRSSVRLKFTAGEDKPYAPTIVLARHSRFHGACSAGVSGGMTDFLGACSRLDRGNN